MINTFNESSLHKTLKSLYSSGKSENCEVKLNGKIYDVINKDGTIIEIQTRNLSKLLAKISDVILQKRKIKIVYPLVQEKTIETFTSDGSLIKRRKSPVHLSIYDAILELMHLYPVLLNENVEVEILFVSIIEKRLQEDSKVQSKNKKRRFCKDWNKSDKCLKKIFSTKIFSLPSDYISLIPKTCLPIFCAKDISLALKNDKRLPARSAKTSHALLWLLSHLELIEYVKIENRSRYYKVKEAHTYN